MENFFKKHKRSLSLCAFLALACFIIVPVNEKMKQKGLVQSVNIQSHILGNKPFARAMQKKYVDRSPAPVKPSFPVFNLSAETNGDQAVSALSGKLAELAIYYKSTPEKLKNELKKDKTLWADKKGRLFYKDKFEGALPSGSEPIPVSSTFDLSQTFLLHSRPGSGKVLYLDFDGAVVSNTAWNASYNSGATINAAPFDIDSNPSSFSDSEKRMIQNIWLRVSEDYAPFDLDVTTEEPPAGYLSKAYSNRDIITPTNFYPNAGGVSSVGTFDDSDEYHKTSWVFSNMLANGEKYIAEACSHEAGHSFGLHHEGTTSGTTYYQGQGNWAPIMGNSYYKPVTQWAKGEYTGANNSEDQLQVILDHGLKIYPDDHGDAVSSADWLNSNNTTSVFGQGIIEKRTDVDVFKFITGSGSVSFSVTPAIPSGAGDLNIKAELKDGAGNILASSDQAGISASISMTLSAGTYYLFIDGVGEADPATTGYSDYGSLGQYFINGTVVYGGSQPPVAAISADSTNGQAPLGVQFNGSGSYDPDGSIASYSWNFGDGSSSTVANPNKIFASSGNFTVALTVTDNSGLSDTASVYISVQNQNKLPTASISATPTSGTLPLAVSFNGSGSTDPDGTIASYSWNFGDGTSSTQANPSKTYSSSGNFTATLTVTDNGSGQGTAFKTITVSASNVVNAPSSLAASISGSTVTLKWADNSSNETGFYIERATKGSGSTLYYFRIKQVNTGVTSFSQTVSVGTYVYRVKAFNSSTGITSAYSNTAQVQRKK
jgi:PKD repeat protein